VKNDERLGKRVCETNLDILAEVVHAVEKESALTLSDFMLRRSLIGFRQCEGLDCCETVAKKMGEILGWSDDQVSTQIRAYEKEIAVRHEYEREPTSSRRP